MYTYAHAQLDQGSLTLIMDLINDGDVTSEGDIKYLAHAMKLSYTNLQLLLDHLHSKKLDDSIASLVNSPNFKHVGV